MDQILMKHFSMITWLGPGGMIRTFTCRWAALKGSKPCWEVSMARSSWCTLAEAFWDFVCMAAWLPKFQFTPKHWSYSIYSTDLSRYKHRKIYDLVKVCSWNWLPKQGSSFNCPLFLGGELKPMQISMVIFFQHFHLSKKSWKLRVFSVGPFFRMDPMTCCNFFNAQRRDVQGFLYKVYIPED